MHIIRSYFVHLFRLNVCVCVCASCFAFLWQYLLLTALRLKTKRLHATVVGCMIWMVLLLHVYRNCVRVIRMIYKIIQHANIPCDALSRNLHTYLSHEHYIWVIFQRNWNIFNGLNIMSIAPVEWLVEFPLHHLDISKFSIWFLRSVL